MTVKEITLLSKEEYEKYKSTIPKIDYCWWLRSPGYSQAYAARVYSNSNIDEYGYGVNSRLNAVRPALKLNLEIADSLFWYKPERIIGTKIKYGEYNWTILNAEMGELYVLCDDIIAEHRFDPDSNDWDKSELKQWLETEGLQAIMLSPDVRDAIYTVFR